MTTPSPMRAFLSMMARLMTQLRPMPMAGALAGRFERVGPRVALVIIRAHEHHVAQFRAAVDHAADADDAPLQPRVREDATVGNDRVADADAVDLAGRQEAGAGVDGRFRVEKAVRRDDVRQREVRVEKRPDRADVLPVILEDVRVHAEIAGSPPG